MSPNHGLVAQAIMDFVSHVPASRIGNSKDPAGEARRLAHRAAQRAALTAGSLALPPGPLGWLTLLPELIAIWKIQGQMVSDIAAAYGRHAALGREQMMWCLFRHTAAQAFRDLVVRMGDRLVFRSMSYGVAQRVARQVGVKLTQRTLSKGISRWLPIIGALGVGAYAYYDTGQVATTAIAMFESEIAIEGDPEEALPAAVTPTAAVRPTSKTSPARRSVRAVVEKTVTGAAQKVASRKPRKPAPEA